MEIIIETTRGHLWRVVQDDLAECETPQEAALAVADAVQCGTPILCRLLRSDPPAWCVFNPDQVVVTRS